MQIHTRRAALLSLAAVAATPVLVHAGAALAQTAPAQSTGEQSDYVMQTLTVGTLSLRMSEVATEKARDPLVQEFAQLEIGEQQAVASVLSATQVEPPTLTEEQMARVQTLRDMEAGPDFDVAYVDEQIRGHEELLQIQRTLSQETEATVEAVTARLAEPAIQSHLAMLNHIREHLMEATEMTEPADGEAPAGGAESPAAEEPTESPVAVEPTESPVAVEPSESPTPADRSVGAPPADGEQPAVPEAPAT